MTGGCSSMEHAEDSHKRFGATLLLRWVTSLLGKDVKEQDVPALPDDLSDRVLGAAVDETWESTGSVAETLRTVFRKDLIKGTVASVGAGLSQSLARPLVLLYLVRAINDDDDTLAAVLVAVIALIFIIEAICVAQAKHMFCDRFGCGWTFTLCRLIRRKAVVVSGTTPPGLLPDVLHHHEGLKTASLLVIAMVSMVSSVTVVIAMTGVYGVFGMSAAILLFLCGIKVSMLTKEVEVDRVAASGKRVSVMLNMVKSIKAIKLSSWEQCFEGLISAARTKELKLIGKQASLHLVSIQIGRAGPAMSAAVTILFLSGTSKMVASDVFALLSAFQSLRQAFVFVPIMFSQAASFRKCIENAQNFLNTSVAPSLAPAEQDNPVRLVNASFRWAESEEPILKEVSCLLKKGSMVAVVGRVGSGKSSLLAALLGGLELAGGEASVASDSVGYVPQIAHVMKGTVLFNILVGRSRDDDRLDASIRATSLILDVNQLPHGLETPVGEGGFPISGGQALRICLTRAIYGEPDLLVLDDPLASVDPIVGSAIFDQLLCPYTRKENSKTVVMALNQLEYLRRFDHVMLVNSGKVVCQGDPSVLLEDKDCPLTILYDSVSAPSSLPLVKSHGEDIITPCGKYLAPLRDQRMANRWSVFKQYLKGMGWAKSVAAAMLSAAALAVMGFSDMFLARWLDDVEDDGSNSYDTSPMVTYGLSIVVYFIVLLLQGSVVSMACMTACKTIHDGCISCVLRAQFSWFQNNPPEKLRSRFTSDLGTVDTSLTLLIEAWLSTLFAILTLLTVLCILQPAVVLIVIAGIFWYGWLIMSVDTPEKEINYLKAEQGGLLHAAFQTIISQKGKLLLQSMRLEKQFSRSFDNRLNRYLEVSFASSSLVTLGMFRSYIISIAFSIATVALLFQSLGREASNGDVGLTVHYAFMLPYFLQLFAAMSILLLTSLSALERLLQCNENVIPQEPSWSAPVDDTLPLWPQKGVIRFDAASLVYRQGLMPALHTVSIDISHGWRVGVVGRTGAGKSSLLTLLFRLVDPTSGSILVDGVDITTVGLQKLRQNMAVIPQEPLLIDGTVRRNLDPNEQYTDARIGEVLRVVGLDESVLYTEMKKKASAGEKQLISLARTLLRRTRIIIMDEPTAHVDPWSDMMLQKTLRRMRGSVTVITIAHRMATVAGSDYIVVMDKGAVAQCGHPMDLLSDPNGKLRSMMPASTNLQPTFVSPEAPLVSPPIISPVSSSQTNPLLPPSQKPHEAVSPPSPPPSPPLDPGVLSEAP